MSLERGGLESERPSVIEDGSASMSVQLAAANIALGRPPEVKRRKRSFGRKVGAFVCMASVAVVAGAGLMRYSHLQGTVGQTETIPPLHEEDIDAGEAVDGKVRVFDWNIHGKSLIAKGLRRAEAEDADVANFQEVNGRDIPFLSRPNWYAVAVKAEAVQHGGLFNVSFVRGQKPTEITTETFDGTTERQSAECSLVSIGSPLRSISDCWQEKRAALAFTIKEKFFNRETGEYEMKDIRIINGQIAGASQQGRDPIRKKVHIEQFDRLMRFVSRNNKDGRPTIACGDMNSPPEKVITRFSSLSFIVPGSRGTMVANKEEINDYCAYAHAGILGMARVRNIKLNGSDHYPIILGANGDQTD